MERKAPWRSRKWWACLIVVAVGVANAVFGLDLSAEEIAAIVLPAVAYILGEAWTDATNKPGG